MQNTPTGGEKPLHGMGLVLCKKNRTKTAMRVNFWKKS